MGFSFGSAIGALTNPTAILGTGLALGSSALDYFGAQKQQQAANEQADEQMAFQERMSSTAHQREVRDLQAAGLNPVLSANSGASTPSGAMAPQVNELAGASDKLNSMVNQMSTAAQISQTLSNVKNIDADTDLTGVKKKIANADARVAEAQAFSAENAQNLVKKYPKTFGVLDAILPRLSNISSTARDAGLFGGSLKYLMKDNDNNSKWFGGRDPRVGSYESGR